MWNQLSKLVNPNIGSSSNINTTRSSNEYDIEKSAYPKEMKKLTEMFPDCDPYYLEKCCTYYKEDHVQRICDKIFTRNHSHFPKLPHTLTSTPKCSAANNYYLESISELFPDVDCSVIRDIILRSKHSIVYKAVNILNNYNGKYKKRQHFGKIEKKDFFRSEAYALGAKQRLYKLFPKIPKSAIRAVLAEFNYDFIMSYERLKIWNNQHTWITSFMGMMGTREVVNDPAMYTFELLQEVNLLENQNQKSRLELDYELATKINQKQYLKEKQLILCNCCYGDYTFEDLGQCSNGHLFCKQCINSYVSETIYGQSSFKEKGVIKCIDTGDCNSNFPEKELERILKPDVFLNYYHTLLESNLEKANLSLARCPFCRYVEIDKEDSLKPVNWYRYFRLGLIISLLTPLSKSILIKPILISLNLVLAILTIIGLAEICSFNILKFIPQYLIPEQLIALPELKLFQCKALECGKLSCRLCHQQCLLSHQCMEDEKEALRLKIEIAMADAVKRTCPNCNLSFTKLDGCNKMTCKCGYIMCYLCRVGIQDQLYAHFCDHFRYNPGESCTQCNKCDLYKDANTEQDMKRAAEEARIAFFNEYPEVKQTHASNITEVERNSLPFQDMEINQFLLEYFFL